MAVDSLENLNFSRLRFPLIVEDGWPPVDAETLWGTRAGSDTYVIDNVPFFVQGIAVGDRIQAIPDPDSPVPVFLKRLSSGGHSTIQVITMQDQVIDKVRVEVNRWNCGLEISPWPDLLAIDIPSSSNYGLMVSFLEDLAAERELEFIEACKAS